MNDDRLLERLAVALERIAQALEDGLALAVHTHVEPAHDHAPLEEPDNG